MAGRLPKADVFGLRGFISIQRSEYFVWHLSPALAFASSKYSYRANIFHSFGCYFRTSVLDNLEGKAVGERLGNCGEPFVFPDVPSTVRGSHTTRLGPSHQRTTSRHAWAGKFLVSG
jgi:hypothetical protein